MRTTPIPRPPGIALGALPELLDNLPHLGKSEAAAFAADLEVTARRTRSERLRDPWASSSTPTSCLAHGFAVVTLNRLEFLRVPGLKVETWR